MDIQLDPLFKQKYEEFMELKLSENNAEEAIKLAMKVTLNGYFKKYCPADIQINAYTKLSEVYNMIGDRANADKYANKVEGIREAYEQIEKRRKVLLSFKNFRDLKLPKNNTADVNKAIELASAFVENQYFLEMCPEKIRNDIYAKLAKAYYLNGDYDNAYKYLCKNTGIYYLDEGRNYEYRSQVCIFDDKFDCYLKNHQQREELVKIYYDVYYKLGYLSEAEYEQYIDPLEECCVRKLLKKDFSKMCYFEFEWVLERFEKIDLSRKNEKDAEEVIEIASKFMNIPIFNERYNKLPMSDIYGKLGKAYYIVGNDEKAITNLINTGRITEKTTCPRDAELKDIYKKACERLKIKNGSISEALEEIGERTNEIGKALKEDPLNFDMQ